MRRRRQLEPRGRVDPFVVLLAGAAIGLVAFGASDIARGTAMRSRKDTPRGASSPSGDEPRPDAPQVRVERTPQGKM